jgi:hypothetical protein
MDPRSGTTAQGSSGLELVTDQVAHGGRQGVLSSTGAASACSGALWKASCVPWIPELFSATALAQFEDNRRGEKLIAVNYFAGLMAGEIDALIDSFAGEPELHHPVRGRIKGARALAAFVTEANAWLEQRDASIEDVDLVVTERRGVEEVLVHLAGEAGQVDLPVAIVADRQRDRRIDELRWGRTELPPEAGVAVYVRGESGKLAAARIYDDSDPPLGP